MHSSMSFEVTVTKLSTDMLAHTLKVLQDLQPRSATPQKVAELIKIAEQELKKR
jgi:hypothetical protein